jgi:arylsulfatase A-like enzyme
MTTPNIVYIVLDQWRGDCLGVANSRHPVMTPHFDQLTDEGLWFRRAYADCPICMPQRATMLSGQSASRHGMPYNFLNGPRTPIAPEISLPYRLSREKGYQTKAVGKMHFFPERARFGFEHVTLHPDDYVNWLEDSGFGGLYRGHGLGGNEVYPAVSSVPDKYTHTSWIIEQSIRFLSQRDPESPFMLWMVFEAPHSPFDPPAPYDRMYEDFDIPEAVHGDWVGDDSEPRPVTAQRLMNKSDRIPAHVVRKLRQHYYGQITHIDYTLGRFFGELKRLGLYDNTAIVVTSDHGEHLGDHRLFAKYTFYESAARIPLILKPPMSVGRAGERIDVPAMTADITPTLLALAGLSPNAPLDGRNLLDLPDERIIFGETRDSVFATDGRLKYLYYVDRGIEQVFDPKADPDDLNDLSGYDDAMKRAAPLKAALIDYLTGLKRPIIDESGKLRVTDVALDESALRAQNQAAWRGPLRFGMGY